LFASFSRMPSILKKTFCLAVIFLLCSNAKGQMVGGQGEAEEGTMKFLVKLEVSHRRKTDGEDFGSSICAGTILEMQLNWVLTAAHCLTDKNITYEGSPTTIAYKTVRMIAGVKNTDTAANRQIREVNHTDGRVFIHPDYDSTKKIYDAALIKLRQPFDRSPTVNQVTVLRIDTMSFDFNREIKRGMSCVYQSWGANKLVPAGDEWTFGYDPPIKNAEDAKVAMQGRLWLQKHDAVNGRFSFSNGDRRPPVVATGDSGAPVLCAHGQQDPLYAGKSGQGVMFFVLSHGFCHKVDVDLREEFEGEADCGEGTDVRILHKWILKTFSENQASPQYIPL